MVHSTRVCEEGCGPKVFRSSIWGVLAHRAMAAFHLARGELQGSCSAAFQPWISIVITLAFSRRNVLPQVEPPTQAHPIMLRQTCPLTGRQGQAARCIMLA